MKKIILLTSFLLSTVFMFGQKHRADNWTFGVYTGLNFSGGSPTLITGDSIYTPEGCSTISDTSGNLLFYTNGVNVWDKNNHSMPNGQNLMGGTSSTQAALIVPDPANTKKYYVFTLDEDAGPNGCRFSIVDMTLNSGLGDVTVKDSLLLTPVAEKLTAVKDPQANRYWIVIHAWNSSNAFYAYELNTSGLQAPVISNAGTAFGGSFQNSYGQMKFDICGNKLALAEGYLNKVELFDFDMLTGIVSNPIVIGFGSYHVYGIEFSPDANKLYISTYNPLYTLVQYDISSGVQSTIVGTQVILSTTSDIYALQLANDGKIYVCKSYNQYLGAINSPDVLGISCNYQDSAINLDPNFMGVTSALGLPGFVQSYFNNPVIGCPTTTSIEQNAAENNLSIYPNPFSETATLSVSNNFYTNNLTVKITDITGKVVKEIQNISSKKILLSAYQLEKGMYFFSVINNRQEKMTGKFIIQ